MKENYFYIDESGGIKNESKFFILGCYKTDTPEELRKSLEQLKNEILESPYFAPQRKNFLKQGIHACENHPDIRARIYNLISSLNIRAYVLLLDKRSEFFKNLISEGKTNIDVYNLCIYKLLKDRMIKNRLDKNYFIFEKFGNKINNWQNNIHNVLLNINSEIFKSFGIDCHYEVLIHDKTDLNLSIIDYINYIFIHCFNNEKPWQRMIENYNIIEPKIGLVYKMDKDLFFDKNKRFSITTY